MTITRETRLSELRERGAHAVPDPDRLARSIRQSLRVEGYDVSEAMVREVCERVVAARRGER